MLDGGTELGFVKGLDDVLLGVPIHSFLHRFGRVDAGKHDEAESMRKEFIDSYLDKAKAKNDAFATGVVDELIKDMKDLRFMVIKGFEKTQKICADLFKS